jgi:hypothetical protein
MGLDLPKVLPQVQNLGRSAARRRESLRDLHPKALNALDQASKQDPESLHDRIRRAGARWRGAIPTQEPIDFVAPAPSHPAQLTVIGADGSQIYPDRHANAFYSLINIGTITIEHGSGRPPITSSRPEIFYEGETFPGDEGPLTSALVDAQRDADEMGALAQIAEQFAGKPTLALLDNGLLLWLALQMSEMRSTAVERLLKEYLGHLDRLHIAGTSLAGFVDRPRSSSVLALLHLSSLPIDQITSDVVRANPFRELSDSSLFASILPPGHRSACFIHASPLNRDFEKAGHQIQFFYLNTGSQTDLARVEVPAWVAEEPSLLEAVHAGLIEQCRTTGGFPYALIRAHELAVVSLTDRKTLEEMLGQALREQGFEPHVSQKSRTKQWLGRKRRHRL